MLRPLKKTPKLQSNNILTALTLFVNLKF